MADPKFSFNEPPLIERARRSGWALLVISLLCALTVSFGWTARGGIILSVACGLLGALAIINVLLVRALYRQVANAPQPEAEPEEP
jgi:hypothetical protein